MPAPRVLHVPSLWIGLAVLLAPVSSWAADPQPGPALTIHKANGAIAIDGDLSDAGWQGIEGITTWFETNIGDNVEPQVKNTGYLAYDDKFFYAGFVFEDPAPGKIRAPIGDHDAISGNTDDYAGVIVDSRNDGKTAQLFLSNPAGVQYDASTNDASGEDSAPDFYWDAMGKVTATGWTLELRIPFSSMRYSNPTSPTFRILLYRNYPRDRRYQFFSTRLPRDVNCFICNSSILNGLANLPHGSHLVVAPFATASQASSPSSLGGPLDQDETNAEAGLDVKWSPAANTAIDATINPDFSQVEADAPQIVANERFALFFPEKRPFFLESVDLFSTPMTAIYTRTITSPRAGVRATGRFGATSYTALVTEDRGGGSVILPGPQGSGDAPQDFISDVGVMRLRRDLGSSFVSMLATGRLIHGGGSNAVFGPDFQWRPKPSESITGQFLWSDTQTPNRTDLAPEWDGGKLSDGAGLLYWSHSTRREDWFVQFLSLGDNFRADNGFIPQVGYREGFVDVGYTVRPKDKFLSRVRFFTTNWYDYQPNGDLLSRRLSVGSGMDGRWNSFFRVELNHDAIRSGADVLERFRPHVILQASPGGVFSTFSIDGSFGQEIDFANAREGTGASFTGSVTLRPTRQLVISGSAGRRWLDIDDANLGLSGRLFTAQVERVRTTWSFNARSFLRLIGQYSETRRDPALYLFSVDPKSAVLSSSALFAYKLNWQTVLYTGYGDQYEYLPTTDQLETNSRQFFGKVSYAWQH
jgi:hypothetical protein